MVNVQPSGAGLSSSPARLGRSPAPRPLRLLDLPVSHTSSSSTSPVSSLEHSTSGATTGLGFTSDVETLIDSSISEVQVIADTRRTTIALPSPSPSSLRRSFSGRDPSRRQSSISYFSPTRERDDPTPRSPLAGPPLSSSNSVGARPKSVGSVDALHTRGSRTSLVLSGAPSRVEDRGPLTLAEKHADLLQFIAQKEAKCMDLRGQLATHEAELAQLKRKWERIVNRGVDRVQPTAAGTPGSSPAVGTSGTRNSADMLEGFREGVQGVGRLLVAGLADLSSVSPLSGSAPGSSPTSRAPKSPDTRPLPPSLQRQRGAPAARALAHAPALSTSSTATTASATSKSTRYSQSSASSLESTPAEGSFDEDDAHLAGKIDGSTTSAFHDNRTEREAKLARRKSREAPSTPYSATTGNTTTLPLASSIPLANIARDTQPVADWVRRKLDSPGATVASANKRASGFFADMGSTLRSALAVPSSPSASSGVRPEVSPAVSSKSLLDDDDDEADAWAALTGGAVLVPDNVPTSTAVAYTPPATTLSATIKSPKSQDDFDDWNW